MTWGMQREITLFPLYTAESWPQAVQRPWVTCTSVFWCRWYFGKPLSQRDSTCSCLSRSVPGTLNKQQQSGINTFPSMQILLFWTTDTSTLPVNHCSQSTAFCIWNGKARETRRKARGHAEKHVKHAEKHAEHAEKHVEHAGTGKQPPRPTSQAEQQHNINSAGTSLLMADNKAMGSSLLFWPVPFGWTMPREV